ncbi:MAG: hypothetical protein IPO78_07740 [Saprospiraceae bacterium]|nr:hypothetical protein [Saprospiraceae bacterium]MBK9721500.1 hypothetical protein [Saprospiraceae bacterium]MBK9728564.1 hypothetical protein [Saprospiraceae bacterium]
MTFLKTYSKGILCLLLIVASFSCNKETPTPTGNSFVNNFEATLVTDWLDLSLDLGTKCNGFNDPIASRALYYVSLTCYESLLGGLYNYKSLQTRINGFNTTLPQADPNKSYNWIIVANQALAIVSTDLYKASGVENLARITKLRDKYVKSASIELSTDIVFNSKELGNEIGWKISDFANADGQADSYLRNFPDVNMPVKEGSWIPTPPDYSQKPLLPYWGNSKLALLENATNVAPLRLLTYSTAQTSIMYSEAVELYNMATNINPAQREIYEYWHQDKDPHVSPVCHNTSLMIQLIKERKFQLDHAIELALRLSIAQYDGYIVSWKTKFSYNLLRPASYIKQNINKYYIPFYSNTPVPDFVSENALIYSACSEILGMYFGYRTPFMDYTQASRTDLRENRKYFETFNIMAKEASYSDMLGAIYFRSSIDAGFQMGYDLAQNVINLELK